MAYKGLNLSFEYAIRMPNGGYYTGYSGDKHIGQKHQAFKYTEAGAYAKIAHMRQLTDSWKNATVERI